MSGYFIETSALVKRYKQERGSELVNRLFESGETLYYADLAVLEIRKVFYRLYKYPQSQDIQKSETLSEEEFHALEARLVADLLSMQRVRFDENLIQKAAIILGIQWLKSVFDLAQLAAFLVVQNWDASTYFVCSDERSKLIVAASKFCEPQFLIIPEQQRKD